MLAMICFLPLLSTSANDNFRKLIFFSIAPPSIAGKKGQPLRCRAFLSGLLARLFLRDDVPGGSRFGDGRDGVGMLAPVRVNDGID